MDRMSIAESVKEWHEAADKDIASAHHLLSMYPVPLEPICYLCQQCAEKYIKSYLVHNDEDVVKTHDLVKLIKLCAEFNDSFMEIIEQCSVLVRYISDTRYPSKLELTGYDVKKALEYAEEIKMFVLRHIHD